ncbi:MAG: 30S ribosome-binding factor RbfA [Xanthomonadales bacterium]|nr:30S ribosome-binding factor RbfA [Xanthomonadales bacterium]
MGHREFQRTDRISALLRRELGQLIHQDVRERYVPEVSVSDVEVSRDIGVAKVYVTALRAEDGLPAVALLNEAAKGYRQALSKVLRLRQVPELRFHYDDSVDRGERIEALLRGIDEPR